MANSFRVETFKDNRVLTLVVIVCFSAIAIISALFAVFALSMVIAPDWALDLGDGESLPISLAVIGLLGLLEIPLRILTAVLFLIWLYRAYSNLSPLKATNLAHSPGWAVGWWFIPFANLVKPFQVVKELYNESDPGVDPESGFTNIPGGTPVEVGFWWASFLISGFAYRFSDRLYGNGEWPESSLFAPIFLFGSICAAASAALGVFIIREVTMRQAQRLSVVESASSRREGAPPPPPQF